MLLPLLVATALAAPLQLAESVPVETTLDDPNVPDAADTWVALIDSAQSQICLSQFYVSPKPGKEPGRLGPVLDALHAAAKRGVTIQFLIDAKFSKTYPRALEELEKHDSVTVAKLDLSSHTGGVQHAKYFIVDDTTAWLGSQNFDWRSLEHITELGVRIEEPTLVSDLRAVFNVDWALATDANTAWDAGATKSPDTERQGPFIEVPHGEGTVDAVLVASPRDLLPEGVDWDLPHILHAIDRAESRVRVQVMSYALKGYDKTYWDELDRALRRAAARGVDVQVVVANWSMSKWKAPALQSLQVMPHIEVRVVSIPEWSGGFIEFSRVVHAKYVVVDGKWSWVGTSNWSRDYFLGSRNVGLVVKGTEFAAPLDTWFERMWTSEYAETVDPTRAYEAPKRN